MTKAEIVKKVQQDAGLPTAKAAEAVYDSLISIMTEALKAGETISLRDFGSLKAVGRAARKGRNPRTGKEILIPESRAVKFTVSQSLKDGL